MQDFRDNLSDRSSVIRLLTTEDEEQDSTRSLTSGQIPNSSEFTVNSRKPASQTDSHHHTTANNIDVSLTFPGSSINYEPITDSSYRLSSTTPSRDLIVPVAQVRHAQIHPHSYLQTTQLQQSRSPGDAFSSSVDPHVVNVPGLVRRRSSRRKLVIKRAPSIKSERNRVSMISEATTASKNSARHRQPDSDNVSFYASKRKLFNFVRRSNSVKARYSHKSALSELFRGLERFEQLRIYESSKREPLLMQSFELDQLEKYKTHPKLQGHLKVVSIDIKNNLVLTEPTADHYDAYYRNYTYKGPARVRSTRRSIRRAKPRLSRNSSIRRSRAGSRKSSVVPTESEKDYRALKSYVFGLKTADSSTLAKISKAREDHIKRLALTIYLRRLIALKITLRTYLENSSSSELQSKHNAVDPDHEFNFVSQSNVNRGEYSPLRRLLDLSQESFLSGRLENLIDLRFQSPAGSGLTFHSFK